MDGDAWGSLWALAGILKNMWKNVVAINDCPVPPGLDSFWDTQIISPDLDVKAFNPDIIISLDASNTSRLGKIYETWEDIFIEKPFIVIDHHNSNPYFWDINIIDVNTTSSCQLLTQVLFDLHLDSYIDSEIATLLYLGLQTDTNMYFNNDVTSETLMVGARLIEKGADFRKVIYEMFQKKSFMQMKLWKYLLENLRQESNGQISYSFISKDNIRELWIAREEIGWYLKGAINELLINIEWTQIAFLIYPLNAKENKVSMRALPWNNVAAICELFSGGWHILASGFQSFESKEDIINTLLKKIQDTL